MIEIDLSKHQVLDADTKAIQKTNFTANHHSAEISVIWLVEQSAIKLLILIRY